VKKIMQTAVERLVQMGPLPGSLPANPALVGQIEALIRTVETPVSDEDARALVQLFGPDDCFGLAWALLHLIETSPSWPIENALRSSHGEWIERLKERAA
jgi:hypothetical protein